MCAGVSTARGDHPTLVLHVQIAATWPPKSESTPGSTHSGPSGDLGAGAVAPPAQAVQPMLGPPAPAPVVPGLRACWGGGGPAATAHATAPP